MSDFVILLILITLQKLKSEKDYFERYEDAINSPEFNYELTTKIDDDGNTKSMNIVSDLYIDHGRSEPKNPAEYCHEFRTCHQCVKSLWSSYCGWCHKFGCTSKPERLCPYAKRSSDDVENINSCPFITHKGPILISAGVRRDIKVKFTAPDPDLFNSDILCQLKFKDKLTHLKAMFLNGHVYCYPVNLNTIDYPDTEKGQFKVIWGGAEPFSNEIPVTVYRCETLAYDCEGCGVIPPEYGCGWCDKINSCVIGEKCTGNLITWTANRLNCNYGGRKLHYV